MKTFLVALLSTTIDIRTVRDGRVVETGDFGLRGRCRCGQARRGQQRNQKGLHATAPRRHRLDEGRKPRRTSRGALAYFDLGGKPILASVSVSSARPQPPSATSSTKTMV